ncbi:hypothetical protein [Nocardioides sp.]|uniref:hypothetical protein n=1 Tax=Nocardioides sp. TaxID=35761 RepID=UPI0027360506|nr:hypothetical protein [Nocardioides sp.]MDP3890156.1 hypothetical protein [Nocardioides sp.]
MAANNSRQRTTLIIATTALVVAIAGSAGPVTAAVFDAVNAHKVDGKHAVGAGASVQKRKGKLVATNSAGRLPNNIIAKARDADKLDGIDSTGFLRKDAQAVDADTVDGRHADDLSVRAVFASGFGANPSSTMQFLATPPLVTVGAGQQVHVTSHKVFGSTAAAGATNLNLWICYRPAGASTPPVHVGGGALGIRVTQNTSVPMGLSAVLPNLPQGSYHVALCGSSSNAANWNFNEFGYTTALVTPSPSPGEAAARPSDQSKPRP